MTDVAEARRFYAALLAREAKAHDSRIETVFATVPREKFLGRGPWPVIAGGGTVMTPSADPAYLYRNMLVALDPEKGINNGEPLLHAMWMARVSPQSGETVCHIGAGTGYYSALLSLLVSPHGAMTAYEIDPSLAARAARNLTPYTNVKVVHGDATALDLPASDIIYVNAGVAAPPLSWLRALKPGGRLVFPWRPTDAVGLAVLVTRSTRDFACDAFMRSWFIPCSGAADAAGAALQPTRETAPKIRSLRLSSQSEPDDSAVAVFDDVWFSSKSPG